MKIFAFASFLAYIIGLFFTYIPLSNGNIEGSMEIMTGLGMGKKNIPILYFHIVAVFVLGIIGLRFYLHAAGIAQIKEFFDSLTPSKKRLESCIRSIWVIIALNLPNIITMQIFIQNGGGSTSTYNPSVFFVFFVALFLMYVTMLVWCNLYLGTLISTAPNRGITYDNASWLTWPDNFALIISLVAAILGAILYYTNHIERIHTVAAGTFVFISIAIIIQLAKFFLSWLISRISVFFRYLKSIF